MNLLLLYASPRRHGVTSRLLDEARAEAEACGHEVTAIRVDELRVAPCRGCLRCRTAGHCTLPDDDAQRVLSLIRSADALLIGSPCYWANMPATLKLLFDRIAYGLINEHPRRFPTPLHKGKRALLFTACTTPFPFNILLRQSRGTVHSLHAVLRPAGFRVSSIVEKGGTRTHPLPTERELRKVRRAIRRL